MTYGEAMIYAKNNFIVANGLADLKPPPHKKRMDKQTAQKYYNKKLFKYWDTQLDQSIPKNKRVIALLYLTGNHYEHRRPTADNEVQRV